MASLAVLILYLGSELTFTASIELNENPMIGYCFSDQGPMPPNYCNPVPKTNSSFNFGKIGQNVVNITQAIGHLHLQCTAAYPIRWLAHQPPVNDISIQFSRKYEQTTVKYVYDVYINLPSPVISGALRCEGFHHRYLAADIFLNLVRILTPESSIKFESKAPLHFLLNDASGWTDYVPCVAKAFGGAPSMRLIRLNSLSQGLDKITPNCAICACIANSMCDKNTFPCFSSNICGSITKSAWNNVKQPPTMDVRSIYDFQDCPSNFGCATCSLEGQMRTFKGNPTDCNGDNVLSCEDYALSYLAGKNECDLPPPTNSKFLDRLRSCIARANENFTVMNDTKEDYDPRKGFKLDGIPDLRSMYQCSSLPEASFYMFPLSRRFKTNATIEFGGDGGENTVIQCVAQGSVHYINLRVGKCNSIPECDLKFKNIHPYVSFLDAPAVNDTRAPPEYINRVSVTLSHDGLVQCNSAYRLDSDNATFGYIHETDYLFTGIDKRKYLFTKPFPISSIIALTNTSTMRPDSLNFFVCQIATFVLLPQIHFEIKYSHGQNTTKFGIGDERPEGSVGQGSTVGNTTQWKLTLNLKLEMATVTCYAPWINSTGFAKAELPFLNSSHISGDDDTLKYVISGASVTVVVIIIIVACIYVRRRKNNSEISNYSSSPGEVRNLTKEELEEFYHGDRNHTDNTEESARHAYGDHVGFKPEMIISSSRLRTEHEVIGKGEFGVVYKAALDDQTVAVKAPNSNADVEYFKAFLKEIKLMAFIGDHENIVKFHGAVVDKIQERVGYAIMELSNLGNLNGFLRKHAKSYDPNWVEQSSLDSTSIINLSPEREASVILHKALLANFCRQIANGMDFVSQKKVIHGDLAARNILVFSNNVVKITDFGLSRKLYNCANYTKTKETPLPWRWMALESLRFFQFSTKSDVWSFGVTMWEIFSLGHIPFPGLAWTVKFVDEIETGLRLPKPHHADKKLYNLMLKCWDNDPEYRPTFSDCLTFFDSVEQTIDEPSNNSFQQQIQLRLQVIKGPRLE